MEAENSLYPVTALASEPASGRRPQPARSGFGYLSPKQTLADGSCPAYEIAILMANILSG